MKIKNRLKWMCLLMGIILSTQQGQCKWDDKSDELPGMNDGDNNTLVIIGAGVLVTGIIAIAVSEKQKENKAEETSMLKKNNYYLMSHKPTKSLLKKMENKSDQLPFELMISSNNMVKPNLSDGIKVGVKFKF